MAVNTGHKIAVFLGLTLLALGLIACGGGAEPEPDVAPVTAELAQADMPTTAPRQTPRPTVVPLPKTSSQTTGIPTATQAANSVYQAYGFTLKLDPYTDFESTGLTASGFTKSAPDNSQGLLTFSYNGASVILYWQPSSTDVQPQQSVASALSLLSSMSPSITLTTASEGDIAVDSLPGRFGGFVSTNSDGTAVGGGLIGGWDCTATSSSFSLIVSGADSTAIIITFDQLVKNFSC